ncbi:uncharacterized protein [Gossypium hirsutum]|uniref:Uncharacterized protein n=1 Tax=Gossypium hirsutum TaxID=3635 RepID=A0ABM3AZK7_GOSHI|nr:uncharacterized protein LOC107922533 [Gossypium hirsutum]
MGVHKGHSLLSDHNRIRLARVEYLATTKAPRKKGNKWDNAGKYNKGHSKPITASRPKTETTRHQSPLKQESGVKPGVVRFDDSSSTENPLPSHIDNGVDMKLALITANTKRLQPVSGLLSALLVKQLQRFHKQVTEVTEVTTIAVPLRLLGFEDDNGEVRRKISAVSTRAHTRKSHQSSSFKLSPGEERKIRRQNYSTSPACFTIWEGSWRLCEFWVMRSAIVLKTDPCEYWKVGQHA